MFRTDPGYIMSEEFANFVEMAIQNEPHNSALLPPNNCEWTSSYSGKNGKYARLFLNYIT